jgi:Putative prokaryotic signal transducing protein
MAYCPRCATEYEENAGECMDCHLALRPGPPPASLLERKKHGMRRDVKLVSVHVFSGGTAVMEAELAKNWLESEGIPCVLPGEASVGMLPVLDVPLLVCEEDADEATRILKEYLESNATAQEDEPA